MGKRNQKQLTKTKTTKTSTTTSSKRRPSRAKSREGTFVELYWEYGDPETYYVYGHVDQPTFCQALTVYYGEDFFYDVDPGELKLRYVYVFHSREGARDSGVDSFLRECPQRRGAFAVTAWDPPTPAERAKASIAKLGARVMHRTIRFSRPSKYSANDGTNWPWPFWSAPPPRFPGDATHDLEPLDPAHKARYAPETLTPADAMELAGIADAYRELITHPARSMTEHLCDLRRAHELWSEGYLKDETPPKVPPVVTTASAEASS